MAKILVIDDDESILMLFRRCLESQGYDVVCASTGGKGLGQLETQHVDLVVTDIMMPDQDGLEVLLALRKQRPNLPVIAISGGMHAMPMDFLPLARKFGARRVFYKPVEMEELLAAVRELLGSG